MHWRQLRACSPSRGLLRWIQSQKNPIMPGPDPTPRTPCRDPRFAPTNWNLVLRAGQREAADAAEALARLCRTYWYPLYAYVRRKGHSVQDAEDLTQGFFEQLMQRRSLSQVRGEGRFRSFLLAALEHYLASEWNRA